MESLVEKIDGIELKVKQLALIIERLKNDNNTLIKENQNLNSLLADQKKKGKQHRETIEKLKLSLEKQQAEEQESTKEIKSEINHYIAQIDDCIAWLKDI